MKMVVNILFSFVVLAFVSACAPTLPVPNTDMLSRALIKWPDMELTDLQTGRKNYVQNCAACHSLHLPGEYNESRWREIMPKMKKKAKISDLIGDSILQYLVTNSDPTAESTQQEKS